MKRRRKYNSGRSWSSFSSSSSDAAAADGNYDDDDEMMTLVIVMVIVVAGEYRSFRRGAHVEGRRDEAAIGGQSRQIRVPLLEAAREALRVRHRVPTAVGVPPKLRVDGGLGRARALNAQARRGVRFALRAEGPRAALPRRLLLLAAGDPRLGLAIDRGGGVVGAVLAEAGAADDDLMGWGGWRGRGGWVL